MTADEFVKQSLALHLFFGRVMKEHSFFLEIGFTPRDGNYVNQADSYRNAFDALLADAIALSNGIVSQEVLQSREIVTPYTLQAEMLSVYYTGVRIQTDLTQSEHGLSGDGMTSNAILEQRVYYLNDNAIELTNSLIQFKANILSNVLSCRMFTVNYPLLIDHIMREAKLYVSMLQKLQSRQDVNIESEAFEQESFWNRIMAEHSKFIRGLLDPTENDLFMAANNFGNEFDQLTSAALQAMDRTIPLKKVTADSLEATAKIRDFNTAGTQGLLDCKIKSMIIPLLGDHVLRESNHYLRLLNMFGKAL
ncbi:hypothetical protein SDC9_94057 [bioreactor metagenome]|uniref:DUF2935 domain-containing protein n=1 Tax=bioreactor metagenome TaxID=1076179 RepID=A0A645A3Q9_9ZZZZ